ncbi:MAG: GAF domain-containing protein [Anaerolineae bacterium]|nr:GAF domain-containing protein [Anaerolineae bacterium]
MEKNLSERRAALLHAGAQVSRNVISILDPEVLLQKTVDIICEEFEFYYAGVFLLDETGEWAELHAGRGDAGAAMVAEGHKLKVGGLSMIGAATGRNQALIALDVGEEPVHFKNPHLPLTRSEMALPLSISEPDGVRVIGALTVQSVEEAAFSKDDITALQAMADQLAIAIHNARMYSQNAKLLKLTTRRARLLEAASQVGKGVASILDLDDLLHKTVDIICDAYGFYYAGVFLLDASGEWAELRTGRGEAGAKMVALGHKLQIGGLSMIGTAIAERHARIALDVGEEAVHFKNPHLPLTRSEMALPLMVGVPERAHVIGALTVQSVEEAAFSAEDISSLQAMADQLAIALDNARLLRELEVAHAELVRTKTYEAVATATTEAIHWIGNKALPITVSVQRVRDDLSDLTQIDPDLLESMREDLTLIDDSAKLIFQVKEHLIGPAREHMPAPSMVEDVVKDAISELHIPAEALTYEVAENLPLAVADTTQLNRAVQYVLQNAVEATEKVASPKISVKVALAEGKGTLYVAVHVQDNGPGIPEGEMNKIWAAFYTTKGIRHAGLGLSACLQIMKQLDGKIVAVNRPEGGMEFVLYIPSYASGEKPAALPMERSVLLVDDDDTWSRFVVAALEKAGNTVTRTADGTLPGEAAYGDFDFVIVDQVLETTSCMKVLGMIAKAGAANRTLVMASSLRVEQTMDLMRFGVRDVSGKPYTLAGLAAKLSG